MKGRPSDNSFSIASRAWITFGIARCTIQIVTRYSELRIDQPFVCDVVDELRIEVPVEIADPLVHPGALTRIVRREPRSGKDLVDVRRDCVGFIEHEIIMLKHGHAPEGMPGQMCW